MEISFLVSVSGYKLFIVHVGLIDVLRWLPNRPACIQPEVTVDPLTNSIFIFQVGCLKDASSDQS